MKKVYVLIGLPGSGKSTWAIKQAAETNAVIINLDTIRTMLNGVYIFDKEKESLVFKIGTLSFKTALYSPFDIIIDQTNLTPKIRRFWLEKINEELDRSSVDIIAVYFSETENNLERRMNEPKGTSKEVWSTVIQQMKHNFCPVSKNEGFDIRISVDGNGKETVME